VHLAWALVPLGLTVLLVVQAAADDSYYGDGRSHWATHPDGQVMVVAAALVNLFAVGLLVLSRGERPAWLFGVAATVLGVVATGFAILAVGAH
jgi:hypothetical protein